jgi:hypothetical protein
MRSSRCEWRRAWTIDRLTGRLPDPVARHVGEDAATNKTRNFLQGEGVCLRGAKRPMATSQKLAYSNSFTGPLIAFHP